jgi:cell division protein FtsB
MSDWLDAARGRFDFLRRVAELRGCTVRVGIWSAEDWLGGAVALRARIGELERRLEELREERDFLRRQVENLTFAQAMQTQKALPNPERRSWWARLWGR